MSILTKEELEAIRKRVDAATPGPWFWLDDGRLYSDGVDKVIGEVIEGKDETWFDLFDTNAEFIAHAREDVPKLLSLVEYQQAELERLNDVIKQLTETTESFLDDKHFYMDELKKTEEALRKANAEIERLRKSEQFLERITKMFNRVMNDYINSDDYETETKELAEFVNDCILDGNPLVHRKDEAK